MSVFDDKGHVELIDSGVMWEVLAELTHDNCREWRGGITTWPEGEADSEQPAHWRIEVNDWHGNGIEAFQHDHLVWVFGKLIRITPEEFERQ